MKLNYHQVTQFVANVVYCVPNTSLASISSVISSSFSSGITGRSPTLSNTSGFAFSMGFGAVYAYVRKCVADFDRVKVVLTLARLSRDGIEFPPRERV